MKYTGYSFRIVIVVLLLCCIPSGAHCNDSLLYKQCYKVGLPIVPGFMGLDRNNNPEGFPLELFMHLADQSHIKYEWVVGSWSELYEMLKNGTLDVLPGTQVSENRKTFLDFLDESIYTMWSELYVHKNNHFKNLYELKDKKIGMVKGDNNGIGFEQYIKDFEIPFEKVYYLSHFELFEGLRNKEVFASAGPSANMMGEHINGVRSAGIFYNPSTSNYAFPKGKNLALQRELNKQLSLLKNAPGSYYYRLYQSYGFANINQTSESIPRWLVVAMYLIFPFIFLIIVFVIILRVQVNRKTQQLKHRESKLKERAIYLQEAMRIGKMGTWSMLLDSNYFIWSKEIFNLMGLKYRSKISIDETFALIHPDDLDLANNAFNTIQKNNLGIDIELRFIRNDGSILYTKQIGVVIKGDEQSGDRILGITHDISEQKKYEHNLLAAKQKAEESERLKTAFLANMSHEIRTPLNAIVGFTELMATTKQTEESRKQYSKIVMNQNKLLIKVINDIIDIAKIESGSINLNTPEEIDVNSLLKEIFNGFNEEQYQHLDFKLKLNGNTGATVLTDKFRLTQILNNFITNALKYTLKGEVTFGYYLKQHDNKLVFFVKDTGLGIAKEKHEIIFERFQQVDTMKQGAGLGLPISKSLAEMLGGSIQLQSEVGKGSEFSLTIPLN